MTDLSGQLIAGRYRIRRTLGQGGMGAVYAAVQEPLEREVALKVVRADLVHRENYQQRFVREARAVSLLSHPNIVTVLDFGRTDDGLLYLAMELLEGETLGQRLKRSGRCPWRRTLSVVRQVLLGLQAAHARGIVHRDLKPDNVMLLDAAGQRDFTKLLDFGLAKPFGDRESQDLTSSGVMPGTPGYIAPEVVLGGVSDDPRGDLYSVGVLWFEMLTGRHPFTAATGAALLLAHATEPLPRVAAVAPDLELPADVEEVLRRLLAKAPDDRPRSALEASEAIEALEARYADSRPSLSLSLPTEAGVPLAGQPTRSSLGHPPPRRSPWRSRWLWAATAAFVVAAGAFGALIAAAGGEPPPPAERDVVITAVAKAEPPVVAEAPPPPVTVPDAGVEREAEVEVGVEFEAEAPAPRAQPKPKRAKRAAVRKKLTSSNVRAALNRNLGVAARCNNTNLKRAGSSTLLVDHCPSYKKVGGRHWLTLVVAPGGEVTDARLDDAAVAATPLGQCVLASVKQWRLTALDVREPITLREALRFEACTPINGVCRF